MAMTSFYFEEYLHLIKSPILKVTKFGGYGHSTVIFYRSKFYLKKFLETVINPCMSLLSWAMTCWWRFFAILIENFPVN